MSDINSHNNRLTLNRTKEQLQQMLSITFGTGALGPELPPHRRAAGNSVVRPHDQAIGPGR